jgi:hypothetical protein
VEVIGHDIAEIPEERVEWLWQGYLARGNLTLLAADPKAGKSTLLFHLLSRMHSGHGFLGLRATSTPTLLFSEEAGGLVRTRAESLDLLDKPIHVVSIQPSLSWARTCGYTKYRVQHKGDKLVILDTISRFWDVTDENDAAQVIHALSPIYAISRAFDASILLLHHTRKGGGAGGRAIRGSNALPGAVDVIMELNRLSPWDTSNKRRLDNLSRYQDTPETQRIILTDDGYVVDEQEDPRLERELLTLIGEMPGSSAQALAAERMVSVRQVQRVVSQLASRGVLRRDGSGTANDPYLFSLATDTGRE